MTVNSFLVHAPDGLVLVDGQLTVSDAELVRTAIADVARELIAVIVTHPHPDHYAGLASIVGDGDVPILATVEVDAIMRRDDALKNEIIGPMMGEEWPRQRLFANQIVGDDDVVSLGGVQFQVESVGPAESHADSIWRLETGDVFVGDLAYNDHHSYLADGNWREWLSVLERLEVEVAAAGTIHVGHGESTTTDVFARQRRYVETFVDAIGANRDAIAAGDHSGVLSRMSDLVSNDALQFLMELSIEPLAAVMSTDGA